MKLLLFCTLCVVSRTHCRKYDIETESIKLYGEDLNAVLLRFRKSPEYLSILDDKIQEMRAQFNQLGIIVVNYYATLLEEKVIELMGAKTDTAKSLRGLRSAFKREPRDPRHFLRLENPTTPSGNPLDQYLKKRQGMTTEKANLFKDMGFEYAGYAIHTIIKNMGPDDTSARSTKLPFGGDHSIGMKTTTEHHEHTVTTPDSDVADVVDNVEVTLPAETFRYTYKHRAHT